MAKTNEKKEYAAFNGKILFDYKGSRDAGIKFWNRTHFSFGKPMPSCRRAEPIPYVDWNSMVDSINAIDADTKKELEILMKQYWRKWFALQAELQEEMLFPIIDKLIGMDKILEEMNG